MKGEGRKVQREVASRLESGYVIPSLTSPDISLSLPFTLYLPPSSSSNAHPHPTDHPLPPPAHHARPITTMLVHSRSSGYRTITTADEDGRNPSNRRERAVEAGAALGGSV